MKIGSPFDAIAINAGIKAWHNDGFESCVENALTAAWNSLVDRRLATFEDYGDLDYDAIIGANVAIVCLPKKEKS